MIDEIDVATFQNFRWWSKGYQILRTRDVIRRKDLELNQVSHACDANRQVRQQLDGLGLGHDLGSIPDDVNSRSMSQAGNLLGGTGAWSLLERVRLTVASPPRARRTGRSAAHKRDVNRFHSSCGALRLPDRREPNSSRMPII
jgi:hypothetical protein